MISNNVETSILQLWFNGLAWPGMAFNGSIGQLYVSLHNADPTASGSQDSFETAYTNYARVSVARVAGQWLVRGNSPAIVTNANPITFPQCGGYGDTLTYWGIGTQESGSGTLQMSGPIGVGAATGFTCDAYGNLVVPGASLFVGQSVSLFSLGPMLQLPSGLSEGVEYTIDSIDDGIVTLSIDDEPVATIAAGSGLLIPVSPLILVPNVTVPSFPSNGLVAYLN
jgi:hypothetical protein